MTKEEAIEILDKIAHISDSEVIKYSIKVTAEAFEMAIAALKVEPCEDTISRKHLLSGIDELMQSPWFNNGKDDDMITHYGYVERKEAVEVVRDLCVKAEPAVIPNQQFINKPCVSSGVCEHDKQKVLDEIKAEIEEHAKINYGLNTDGAKALCWCLNVIDKYKEGESE